MPEWHSRKELHRVAMEVMGHTDEVRLAHMAFEPVVNDLWELTQSPSLFAWYGTPMYAYSCVECAADFSLGYARLFAQWLDGNANDSNFMGPRKEYHGRPRILDVGAGIGATTRLLHELTGLNVTFHGYDSLSYQNIIARQLFEDIEHDEEVGDAAEAVARSRAGAVVMFELLEHEQDPIAVLEGLNGHNRVLCLASSFTQERDLGHWKEYVHGSETFTRRQMGRALNTFLRDSGWKLEDTGFWNGRPQIWTRA